MPSPDERRDAWAALAGAASGCTRCPELVAARRQVVFATGSPAGRADLLVVGLAPDREEDAAGAPFVGRAGKVLDDLLGEVGVLRDAVVLTTLVKCHPPQHRDPAPGEVEQCRSWLHAQLELVAPKVVLVLGNAATKLVRDDPAPVTRVRGHVEVRTIGPRTVRLLPAFHPVAALYRDEQIETLRHDLAVLPRLLALPAPPQAGEPPAEALTEDEPLAEGGEPAQLELF